VDGIVETLTNSEDRSQAEASRGNPGPCRDTGFEIARGDLSKQFARWGKGLGSMSLSDNELIELSDGC